MQSLQILEKQEPRRAEGSPFTLTAISSHLRSLNYPEISILNMMRCGEPTGLKMLYNCNCDQGFINLSYRCNLRTCPVCSKKRQRRLVRKYLPHLSRFSTSYGKYQLYFITISPPNYKSFKEGMIHLRKSFNKFLRTKFIKERVQGGYYVIHTKENSSDTPWNLHIHAIFYSRRLDNQIRGKCLDCGQNLMKWNYTQNLLYCANRNCNSLNVIANTYGKTSRVFMDSAGLDAVHINIQKCGSSRKVLNYMIKHVSVPMECFQSAKSLAFYICNTRKHKLVNSFGILFNQKLEIHPVICPKCNSPVFYQLDFELSNIANEEHPEQPPPVLTLLSF